MASRPGFIAPRLLSSGRWQARVRDPKTRKIETIGTFATRKEAEEATMKALTAQRSSTWTRPKLGKVKLETFANEWLTGRTGLRPKTLDVYRYALDHLILPELGMCRLASLDPPLIRTWYSTLGLRVKSATTAKAYRLLRQILDAAVEDGYIAKNPCTIKGASTEVQPVLVIPEATGAIKAANLMPERFKALILICAFGGLRLGEAIGLRWVNVDLADGSLNITEAAVELNGKIIVGPPKTAAGFRTVYLPTVAAQSLRVHHEAAVDTSPSALVFPNRAGTHQGRSAIQNAWGIAKSEAGLDGVRLHDLRHLAATLGAVGGATVKENMTRLGHSSPQAALRYQHVLDGRGQAVAGQIDKIIDAAIEAEKDVQK